jgi:hypothetical protein
VKRLLTAAALLLTTVGGYAQPNEVQKDKGHIKKMCGCYQVDFEYAETFSAAKDYEYRDRYTAHGLEWIFVDEEDAEKLVIQHLLVINDSMIIKHWRQDWLYQNREVLEYKRNLEWDKKTITESEANGTWTQKVYQVDDSPRYQGYATWIDVDGKTYWESQVSAPLPRREYTTRSDYNVMLRNNKHKITDYGHVHELDNGKVIRTEEKDSILVWEKGMNTYTKVDDSKCQPARDWWKNNREYWVDVRQVWDEVLASNNYINLQLKVENQSLWQRIFALGDEYMGKKKYNSTKAKARIRETIEMYLTDTPSAWETASAK